MRDDEALVSRSELTRGNAKPVFTIGHSTRPLEKFIDLLKAHAVTMLVDVRTIPRSRHNPQFNRDTLPLGLDAAGIGYTHMAGLGGLRHARPDSVNTGWHNLSFRGFADHMASPEFIRSLDQLIGIAQHDTIAIMCAEAVPWRCHRSLIADALIVRGLAVEEITGLTSTRRHILSGWARVDGEKVTYPSGPPGLNRGDETRSDTTASAKTKRLALTTRTKTVKKRSQRRNEERNEAESVTEA
jgi:hypothetical protein